MVRRRILLVHDSPEAAAPLEASLAMLGYEVAVLTIAPSRPDAAEALTEPLGGSSGAPPDLVLIRTEAPAGAGAHEVAETIRARDPALPILFVGPEEQEPHLREADVTDPDAFLAVPFRDRELRAHVELALSRSDAARAVHELDAFFDVSLDMFCFLGFDGYFRRLNLAWESTLGFTRAELMAHPFTEFVHPADRERTLSQNAQVRAGDQAWGFENRYLCRDGSYRWLLWNATPVTASGVIYSAARDITARKQADAERAELIEKLERSLTEVRTLQGILPICSYCRKIRDDENYWHTVESYVSQHTSSQFSHSICPACLESEVEPQFGDGPPPAE
jgi:PAS domain S-box-containing protein